MPQNEYEAYLNEYYRNHYEQLYIQLAAEYEASLKAYEEARAKADAAQANQPPPDDGYQVPQVDFKVRAGHRGSSRTLTARSAGVRRQRNL